MFQTASNSFKLFPTHFSRGGGKFCRSGFAPLVTGLARMILVVSTGVNGRWLSHRCRKSNDIVM